MENKFSVIIAETNPENDLYVRSLVGDICEEPISVFNINYIIDLLTFNLNAISARNEYILFINERFTLLPSFAKLMAFIELFPKGIRLVMIRENRAPIKVETIIPKSIAFESFRRNELTTAFPQLEVC
ncbi:MAG: hypothetical protein CME62_12600 [Halobacteriovoraceae bacterium]|nr:hypothetical protein [Halobacteriovoraceae bacterium]|tara:strand:+ start:16705 stop:17088 length:384 start_codon:yes stop_codon:yes gene_type:complete